ncbi:flavoprotein WrbA [Ascoidea rubescens DSM 1968]|uniref:Flavo protein WrbA n=1 Tax=Ascoidea rubescens DSM 1968 TaxID=1344418 RepID=A0A1D2VDR9_9ASCO|nr:flavo protein WrbA [Ascoidea rubescens DSM 1968]ODV59749.1 flavo protein WrbA [Ascoidea rubescens DSM 1968]
MSKVAILAYSMYGHIFTLADSLKKGVESAGGTADIYQLPETLSEETLQLLHAPEKPFDIPIATLETLQSYDSFLFGIPTRFGNVPAQWKSFWDSTGALWANGALHGKTVGFFVSTGTPNGGQETTVRNSISMVAHHGMIYIPLGYKGVMPQLSNLDEVHGGSPWGAGTLAGADGSRKPSELELKVAFIQGLEFYNTSKKFISIPDSVKVSSSNTPSSVPPSQSNSIKPDAAVSPEKKLSKRERIRRLCVIM